MTTKITDISSRDDAMLEALYRFRKGNDNGDGFPWTDHTIAVAHQRAVLVLTAATDTEVDVYRFVDGSEVAVGDVQGPWAVTISPAGEPGPTPGQIEQLRTEAGAAGDLAQVAICERALAGDREAVAECARVISGAEAMADD